MKFYNQEVKLRKVLKYPPFCDIIKLEVSDFEDNTAHGIIMAVYDNLLKLAGNTMQIFPPMHSPISKIKNRYRWRIIVKCKVGSSVINKINSSVNCLKVGSSTRISIDINPNNMN